MFTRFYCKLCLMVRSQHHAHRWFTDAHGWSTDDYGWLWMLLDGDAYRRFADAYPALRPAGWGAIGSLGSLPPKHRG